MLKNVLKSGGIFQNNVEERNIIRGENNSGASKH